MKSSRITKFTYLVCIISIFFIGDRMFSEIIAHFVLKSGTKFSRTYRGKETNDIVIMGNSRGDSSFSPNDIYKKTGLSTFQLSHQGVSTEIIECLWHDYIENNAKPKALLLEITNLYSSNDALADLKAFMYWSETFSNLLQKENYKSFLASKISNLYLWNGEVLFRSFYFIGRSDQNKIIINTKQINNKIANTLLENASNYNELTIKNNNMKALDRILQLAQKRGVIVHLIFPPYVPQYVDLISKSKNDLINNLISNTKKFNNIYIHDMSRSITDITMFEDLTHLNYNGSKQLLKLLLEMKVYDSVTDHITKISELTTTRPKNASIR